MIGRGRLLADCTMEEFIARSSGSTQGNPVVLAEDDFPAILADVV